MDEYRNSILSAVTQITSTDPIAAVDPITPADLKRILERTPYVHFVIAYSGGIDSHVLLDLAAKLAKETGSLKISALHIHHGLSENADHWAKHCENICAELKVPLTILWVNAENYQGRSPEEVAREARYRAFEEFLSSDECLLLAHHAEDQAETILLRLFRGTGPLGLGGMPEQADLGQGKMLRPLLSMPKQNLIDYANAHQLNWIEDESNESLRFDRNFLRAEILPKLTTRWPRVVRAISRAGNLCLETATAVQELAKEDFEKVLGKSEDSLSVVELLKLDPVRRRSVIRLWLQVQACMPPSYAHMERIDLEILQAKPDAKPKLRLGDYEIYRRKKELLLKKLMVTHKRRIKVRAGT